MKLTIGKKIFLSIATAGLLVVGTVVGLISWETRDSFAVYLSHRQLSQQNQLAHRLEQLYGQQGNWKYLEKAPSRWKTFLLENMVALSGDETKSMDAWVIIGLNKATAQASEGRGRISADEGPVAGPTLRLGQQPPTKNGAPALAYAACVKKKSGDSVYLQTPKGAVQAVCELAPDGLFARPITLPEQTDRSQRPAPQSSSLRPDAVDDANQDNTEQRVSLGALPGLANRLTLFDTNDRVVIGFKPGPEDRMVTRVLQQRNSTTGDELVIGKLGLHVANDMFQDIDVPIKNYMTRLLLIALIAVGFVSIFFTFIFTKNITSVIQSLSFAVRNLTLGRYETVVNNGRRDEFSELIDQLNHLAAAIEQQEESRRLWVAKTSHELRTPLSVLRAHIEALIDGVRTPGANELERLHREVMRIGKLVTDLNELSRADSGALAFRKEPTELLSLIEEIASEFSERLAKNSLRLLFKRSGRVMLHADQDRIRQLFSNLFENSIRYTDAPGVIRITCEAASHRVIIIFEDSSPGVDPTVMANLFMPFYRADQSRQRERAGSGLGLAIGRAIIIAHEGEVEAQTSDLGGLAVVITLPLLGE